MRGLQRMRALAFWLLAASGISTPALAENAIVRWVDADGVTHYGDARFAPNSAMPVELAPTNGMDVPAGPARTSSRRGGPVWTVIDRQPKQNKVGWRSKSDGPSSGHISPSQR